MPACKSPSSEEWALKLTAVQPAEQAVWWSSTSAHCKLLQTGPHVPRPHLRVLIPHELHRCLPSSEGDAAMMTSRGDNRQSPRVAGDNRQFPRSLSSSPASPWLWVCQSGFCASIGQKPTHQVPKGTNGAEGQQTPMFSAQETEALSLKSGRWGGTYFLVKGKREHKLQLG